MKHLLVLMIVILGCAKVETVSVTPADKIRDAVEATVTSLGGALDDMVEEPVESTQLQKILDNIFTPNAIAACNRIIGEKNGSCIRDVNCDQGSTRFGGSIVLNFKDSAGDPKSGCRLEDSGDYLLRIPNFTRQGSRGLVDTKSTSMDFQNNLISGGIKVARLSYGYSADIYGISKIITGAGGKVISDVSLVGSTTSYFGTDLRRSERTLSSGKVKAMHNTGKFIATQTLKNLTWEKNCCLPVSGSVFNVIKGAISGTANVDFTGCGKADLNFNGNIQKITLQNCE